MKRKVLPFDGGMNEVSDSSVLPINGLTDIKNYEHKTEGKITRRVAVSTFDSALNTEIASIFDETIYQPEEPYYPTRIPTGMYGDVMYPVFGIDSGDYYLYLFYKTGSTTWDSEKIDITGINYTAETTMRIAYANAKMVVVDWGAVNKSHYVTVNNDNEIVSGINEIPRPLNKPEGFDTDSYNASIFQENLETGSYINYCGIYRYFYTFITEFGDESNPSPASEWIDMQFFKKDDDGLDERQVKSVTFGNLEITDNAVFIKNEIKYFGIYREELEFTSGTNTKEPVFIKQLLIPDKDGTNEFTDTVAILSGDTAEFINYENDTSPIGGDICGVGGTFVLGGIKKKLEFPFTFDNYREVILTNLNAKAKTNCVVIMEFDDEEDFGVVDDTPDWAWLMENKDKVRMFDSDLTTPLPCIYSSEAAISYTGFTDLVTDGDFATDPESASPAWVLGGSWTWDSTNHYMYNTTGIGTDLLSQPIGLNNGEYYICDMSFRIDGGDEEGLNVEDYYLQVKDGNGSRHERFIMKADRSSTDFRLNKTAGASVYIVDNVEVYKKTGLNFVAQNLTNPEMEGSSNWTPQEDSAWFNDDNNWYNSQSETTFVQGATAIALAVGFYYLVTVKVYIKDSDPANDALFISLGDNSSQNGFGIKGNGNFWVSAIVKCAEDYVRVWKMQASSYVEISYCRVTNAESITNKIRATFKVPEVPISSSKTIYQTWCEQGGSKGVTDAQWRYVEPTVTTDPENAEYGEFLDCTDSDQWAGQEVFENVSVEDENTLVCSPMQINELTTKCYNKSNVNFNGEFQHCSFGANNITNLPNIDKLLPQASNSIEMDYWTSGIEFGDLDLVDLPLSGGMFSFYMSYDGDEITADVNNKIGGFRFGTGNYVYLRINGCTNYWELGADQASGNTIRFTGITYPLETSGRHNYHITLSWFDDDKISLFVYDLDLDNISYEEITSEDFRYDGLSEIYLGKQSFYNSCITLITEPVAGTTRFYVNNLATEDMDTTDDFYVFDAQNSFYDTTTKGTAYNTSSVTPSLNYVETTDVSGSTGATIGGYLVADAAYETIEGLRFANVSLQTGLYLSASNDNHINAVYNLANRMPLFEDAVIGYDWTETDPNLMYKNVEIGNIESLAYKDYPEWLGYSKVNGVSFPDKFIKKCASEILRVIPVPSYLRGQTKYSSSVVVFYRNGFNVFPLEGDPSTWEDSAENLVPERKRDGLVNKETLIVTPFGLMWQSESGLMLWNSSEYKNVSFQRMDLPIKDTLKGIYLPLTQQYILHDNAENSETSTVTFQNTKDIVKGSSWNTAIYKKGVKIFIADSAESGNNKGNIIHKVSGGTLTMADSIVNSASDQVTIKTTKSYVYDIPKDKWTTFTGLDIVYATALSGGSTLENVNLFLDSYGKLNEYPNYNNSKTEILAEATKVFDTYYSDYESFEPVIEGTATYDVTATDTQNSHSKSGTDITLRNYKVNQFAIGYYGEKLSMTIKNADAINNVIVAYNPRKTRR